MRHQDGRLGRANLVMTAILAVMALGADDPPRKIRTHAKSTAGPDPAGAVLLPNGWSLQAGRAADAAGRLPGADRRASPEPDAGRPPRRLRRARGLDARREDRPGHRPRGHPGDLLRPGLVGRRQAALRRRRVRRRDLRLRPRRRPALEPGDVRLPRGESGTGQQRQPSSGSPRAWRSRPTARRLWVANAFGHTLARFDTESGKLARPSSTSGPILIPTAWPGTRPATGST